MKYYSRLLLSLIFCITATSLFAQWAGPDKTYLVNQSVGVNIGQASQTDGEFCYTWSAGPNGHIDSDQDIHSPVIRVYPTAEEEVYYVQRVGIYGVEEDEVVIRRVNSITISATPKKSCFNAGETISVSDFEITTSPEGFEQMVSIVSPRGKKFNDSPFNTLPTTTEFVTLGIRGVVGPETHDIQVPVDVVYPEKDNGASWSTSLNVGAMVDLLFDQKIFHKKIGNIEKAFNRARGRRFKVSPCQADLIINLNFENYARPKYKCSNGQLDFGLGIKYNHEVDNPLNFGAGLDCSFFVAGCKYLIEADIEFSFSILFDAQSVDGFISDKTDLEWGFNLLVKCDAGIGVNVLSGLIAHATLRLECDFNWEFLWRPLAKSFSFENFSIPFYLTGSVDWFSGVFEKNVKYELFTFDIEL